MALSHTILTSFIISLLAHGSQVLAQHDEPIHPTPLLYTPNKIVSIVAGTLFMLVAAGFALRSFRYRASYIYLLMLGCIGYGLGLLLRIVYANDPTNQPAFTAMDMLILLSPCCFVFALYLMLKPLATYLNAVEFLVINPDIITYVFVGFEIVAFILQLVAGAMKTSDDRGTLKAGGKIVIAGHLVQLFGLLFFFGLYIFFIVRMWSRRKEQWNNRPQGFHKHWLFGAAIIGVCCQNLMIPTLVRVTAIGLGPNSDMNKKEYYFYMSEVMTMFGAIANLLWAYPPKFLNGNLPIGKVESESSLESAGSN